MSPRRAVAAWTCALAVLAAACDGGGDAGRAGPGPTTSPATSTTAPAPTSTSASGPGAGPTTTMPGGPPPAGAPCPAPPAFDRSVEVRPPGVGGGLLTGVAVAPASTCTDDVTFTFRLTEAPGRPIVTASYQPGPFRAGSGEEVAVEGGAHLVVRLEPAWTADLSGGRATPTYTGPRRIGATGTRHVREVVLVGDFEAVVTWVVGMEAARPVEVGWADGGTLRVRVG